MMIKDLTLVFENCETVTIDGKYIGDFLVDDIKTYISRSACNWIGKETVANTFVVEICKDADKDYNPFNIEDERTTVFNRITSFNDITQIDFTLYDQYSETDDKYEEDYHYLINWEGDNNYNNDNQKSFISNTGNLYLVISEKPFEEFVDKETVNDKDYIDFHFSMCDVGDENNKNEDDIGDET